MTAKGTEETDLSSDSLPESGHRDSESRKRPFLAGRSVPIADVADMGKRTFRNAHVHPRPCRSGEAAEAGTLGGTCCWAALSVKLMNIRAPSYEVSKNAPRLLKLGTVPSSAEYWR